MYEKRARLKIYRKKNIYILAATTTHMDYHGLKHQ